MNNEFKVWHLLTIIFFVVCIGLALAVGGCEKPGYSVGFRDGTLTKFSHKGLFTRSWEGSLALSGFHKSGDSLSNVWDFSVNDEDTEVINALNAMKPNQLLRLHYNQVYIPNGFAHETSYRITRVEIIKE